MRKMSRLAALLASFGVPAFVAAQTGINTAYIKSYSDSVLYVINNIFVPTLFAIAFLVFLYGVYRYFIQGADSDTERATGRQFVLWGVVGFVVIVSLWGVVNLFSSTLGLAGIRAPSVPTIGTGTYAPPGGTGNPGGTYVPSGGASSGGGSSTLGRTGGMTPVQTSALTALTGQYNTCLSSGSPYSAACSTYTVAFETYNSAFPSSGGGTNSIPSTCAGLTQAECSIAAQKCIVANPGNATPCQVLYTVANSSPYSAQGTSSYNTCISDGGDPLVCQCEASGGAWNLTNQTCSNSSSSGGISRTCTELRATCLDEKGVLGACGSYNGGLVCFGGFFPTDEEDGTSQTCSSGDTTVCECEANGGTWNTGGSVCETIL